MSSLSLSTTSSQPPSWSSGSRQSSINSSTSSNKKVAWGENSTLEFTTTPITHRKERLSLDSFKRKLLRFTSKDNLKHRPDRRSTTPPKALHGILKRPATRFSQERTDPAFDWAVLTNDLVMRASIKMDDLPPVPPLLPSMDGEETPISSAVSTPPAADLTNDHWETASDYFSDQWEVTPKLLNEWDTLFLDDTLLPLEESVSVVVPPHSTLVPILQITGTLEESVAPHLSLNESVPTPGEFVDGLASSLQYTLAVCGIGFLVISFLIIWTVVLLTCGVMIASAAPAVLLAYWLLHLITRVKYSLEWIALTAIKIGGLLGLGIGFSTLVLIDLLVDEIESIAILALRALPILTIIGVSTTALFILPGTNTYDLIAYGIGFFLSI